MRRSGAGLLASSVVGRHARRPAWHAPRVPDGGDPHDGQAKLATFAWSVTALICLLTAVILGLKGYYGYGFVTFAVAVAAAINLGD